MGGRPGGAFQVRVVKRPEGRGACRGEGLVVRQHVPDGLAEPAGQIDAGDFLAPLAAQPGGMRW